MEETITSRTGETQLCAYARRLYDDVHISVLKLKTHKVGAT